VAESDVRENLPFIYIRNQKLRYGKSLLMHWTAISSKNQKNVIIFTYHIQLNPAIIPMEQNTLDGREGNQSILDQSDDFSCFRAQKRIIYNIVLTIIQ
jgi:hypothetical protein